MDLALESIIMENLSHDVDYILYVYDKQSNIDESVTIDTRRFMTPYCWTPQDLWVQITCLINSKGRGAELIEVMPLVDEFIEFVCTRKK